MKEEGISKFENSLKDYLISYQAGHYGEVKQYSYKYNNLKFFMNPERTPEAHFYVQIGISEACYGIEGGIKLDGSLGREDRLVLKWSKRYNINKELVACWEKIYQKYQAELAEEEKEYYYETEEDEYYPEDNVIGNEDVYDEDDDFPEKEIYKMQEDDDENSELEVDMTSTGISKRKRIIAQERKRRLIRWKKKDKKNYYSSEQQNPS